MSWLDMVLEKLVDFIVGILLAAFSGIVLNRVFKSQRELGKRISDHGISKINIDDGKLSDCDKNKLFGQRSNPMPDEIYLCFLSGVNFFNDNLSFIEKFVKAGKKVYVLLQNPTKSKLFLNYDLNNHKYKDIDYVADYYYKLYSNDVNTIEKAVPIEMSYVMLTEKDVKDKKDIKNKGLCIDTIKNNINNQGDHISQVIEATRKLCNLNKNGNQVEIRYYNDEYQMPMIYALFNDSKNPRTLFWTNLNTPIKEAKDSVNLYCESIGKDTVYMKGAKESFEYLFEKYSHTSSNDNYLNKKKAQIVARQKARYRRRNSNT